MKGYYVIAFYRGNFYYRFVPENATTVYMDWEVASFPTEEEALAALNLLEQGYKLGFGDGYALCEQDYQGIN
jgi:hypothetical protein